MRPWLKVEPALVKHRKTRKLARLWHCHPYQVVGFLVSLWGYCLEYQENGDVTEMLDVELEELAAPCTATTLGALPTVREALTEAGFLDASGRLHDWNDYTGAIMRERRKSRKRQQLHREQVPVLSRGENGGASRSPRETVTGQSRVEESRGEESTAAAAPRDFPLNTTGWSIDALKSLDLFLENLRPEYFEAVCGTVRSAQQPQSVVQSLRGFAPGGIDEGLGVSWDVVGKALFELRAAGGAYAPARLRAFIRGVLQSQSGTGATGPQTDAERMRALRLHAEGAV